MGLHYEPVIVQMNLLSTVRYDANGDHIALVPSARVHTLEKNLFLGLLGRASSGGILSPYALLAIQTRDVPEYSGLLAPLFRHAQAQPYPGQPKHNGSGYSIRLQNNCRRRTCSPVLRSWSLLLTSVIDPTYPSSPPRHLSWLWIGRRILPGIRGVNPTVCKSRISILKVTTMKQLTHHRLHRLHSIHRLGLLARFPSRRTSSQAQARTSDCCCRESCIVNRHSN